jgi:DNA repair protein RadA/Sms
MAKTTTVFICQNCGAEHPKWSGQCSNCGQWNTLVEEVKISDKGKRSETAPASKPVDPKNIVPFSRVDLASAQKRRFSTQLGELDRVLGGGLVPGAVVLIGGEPGIGKSTLLTQMVLLMLSNWLSSEKAVKTKGAQKKASAEQDSNEVRPILYVCGEESPAQISLRIKRILENEHIIKNDYFVKDLGQKIAEHLLFVTTTDVDEIVTAIHDKAPSLIIIDSIQTMQTTDLTGAEGSVGQIRESTQRLTDTAKKLHIPMFLVGHVTKEGTIAGPKVLEHIVDSVVELTGERTGQLRLLRAIKNRFGATDEVGVFKIVEYGLEEVSNPSELFLEHTAETVPGSATVCVLEGRLDDAPGGEIRHGASVLEVAEGRGRYAGARGRITSNFVLSPDGEITDEQVLVLFIQREE